MKMIFSESPSYGGTILLSPPVIAFLAIFVIVSAAYAPYFLIPFAHHDQYRLFREGLENYCSRDPTEHWLLVAARPIGWGLECLTIKTVHTVADLGWVRLLTVAMLALLGALVANWVHTRQSLSLAFTIAVISSALLLPGSQSVVFWGSTNEYAGAILGFAAYCLLPGTTGAIECRTRVGRMVAAGLTLVLADLAYPPAATFFLVPCFIAVVLAERTPDDFVHVRRHVLHVALVFALSSFLFFILGKYYFFGLRTSLHVSVPESYRFHLAPLQILEKAVNGLPVCLAQLLDFWSVYYPSVTKQVVVLGVMAAGVALGFRRAQATRRIGRFIERGIYLFGLFFASTAPWLFSPMDMFLHRVFLVPGLLIFISFLAAILSLLSFLEPLPWLDHQLSRALLLAVILCPAILIAAETSFANSLNSYDELLGMQVQIAPYLTEATQRIHVVRDRDSLMVGYNGWPQIGDEFNVRSSKTDWDVPDMVRAALLNITHNSGIRTQPCIQSQEECLKSHVAGTILVTTSPAGEPVIKSPATIVVSMPALSEALGVPDAH